jgi:hypothetical protein
MELLVLAIGLVALDLLAMRFGADSRAGFGRMAHGPGASVMGWSDPAYEQELAQELLQARRRRLARNQDAATPLQQAHRDLARAA